MSNTSVSTRPTPDGNVADLLRFAARNSGARPALIAGDEVRTWADLDRAASAGAAWLAARTAPGDRVLIRLPEGPSAVLAQFAALRAGLILAPVSVDRSRESELVQAVAELDLTGCLGEPLADGRCGPVHASAEEIDTWWEATDPAGELSRGADADIAWLGAASGPRKAMLSHRAMLSAVLGITQAPKLQLRPEDRAVVVLPIRHLAGWVTAFLPLTLTGGAAVFPAPAAPGAWIGAVLTAIRDHRVTVVPAAPGLYRRLAGVSGVDRALASVRLMTSAATPLDPEDITALRAVLGQSVWEGYGTSETCSVVTTTLMTAAPRVGSVGLPIPGVEMRIAGDEADASDLTAAADQAYELLDDSSRLAEKAERAAEKAEKAVRDKLDKLERKVKDKLDPAEQEAGERPDGDEPASEDQPLRDPGAGEAGAAAAVTDPAEDIEAEDIEAETADAGGAEADGAEGESARDESEDAEAGEAPEDETAAGRAGDIGPIMVRGDHLFSGYWPDGAGGPDADGWFATGDIGYLDDRGELHLVDRAEESFTVSGFTVFPREVEDALDSHPYVRDAAVVAVPDRGTNRIVAVLVAERGTRPTPGDLDDHLASRLPSFKRPAEYVLVERMPRNELGRIDRKVVGALVGATPIPTLRPPAARGAADTDDDLF